MVQITLSFKDETLVGLRRDFDTLIRLSLKFDPQFVTPSFEDFLRAKLLDNPTPLTEQASSGCCKAASTHGQSGALDKEFPDVVGILMRQAAEHGFGFAVRSEWTPDDLIKARARGRRRLSPRRKAIRRRSIRLASQIKAAATDIRDLEQKMQTAGMAGCRIAAPTGV